MGSLYDLLKQRRMVRHYTGEPAPRDALERIVETVRRAPSAGFSQGQRLLVVDDPELLARIAALGDDEPLEGVEPWFETAAARSEERRVGKEWRSRAATRADKNE